MIVLSEATPHKAPLTSSERDALAVATAAQMGGCRVYYIPADFRECGSAENALWHVPPQERPTPGVWSGFIPSPERYEAVYTELYRKRIYLPNTPAESLAAVEFDRSYPRLVGLTPESRILSAPEQWEEAADQLGFPVFERGTARSRKAAGWKACTANDAPELREQVEALFALPYRSRGRVVVRKLVRLRHTRVSAEGFPLGREYRVFLYRDRVLGFGYYWEGDDPQRTLAAREECTMLALAREAAARVGVPFLAVDVGQLEEGSWTVIEVGDGQFAGSSQTPLLPLLNAIRSVGDAWKP